MKKLFVFSLVGLFLIPMLSFVHSTKNRESISLIGDEVWYQIPADNSSTSWVKVIEKPTPNKPNAMKNAIYFDEQKITFINKNGVVRDYMNKAELVDAVKSENEKPRVWKIPHPKSTPKDEDDYVATFQIFKKGIVLTFKADGKPMVFTLKA